MGTGHKTQKYKGYCAINYEKHSSQLRLIFKTLKDLTDMMILSIISFIGHFLQYNPHPEGRPKPSELSKLIYKTV
ncbi:hypothetical protein CPI24_02460 [Moraxella catarrhalis]|nr:hypothetical protein [Moraxella catarrhalis]